MRAKGAEPLGGYGLGLHPPDLSKYLMAKPLQRSRKICWRQPIRGLFSNLPTIAKIIVAINNPIAKVMRANFKTANPEYGNASQFEKPCGSASITKDQRFSIASLIAPKAIDTPANNPQNRLQLASRPKRLMNVQTNSPMHSIARINPKSIICVIQYISS